MSLMADIEVLPSSIFGNEVRLLPQTGSVNLTQRPESRRSSSSPKFVSPKMAQTPLQRSSLESRNSKNQRNAHLLKRSNTNPELPSRKMFSWNEPLLDNGKERCSVSAGGSKPFIGTGLTGMVQVEHTIREKVRRHYSDMREAFQLLDTEKKQQVHASDFRRVIHSFCLQLTGDQFDHLLMKIGAKKGGMINYIAFLEKFRTGSVMMPDLQKSVAAPPRKSAGKGETYDEVEHRLKERLTAQFAGFMKAVRLFDYNRDGHVQRNELKRILDSCCFKLQDAHFDKLLQNHVVTPNYAQTVEYMDFLRRLGVEPRSRELKPRSPLTPSLFLDRSVNSRDTNRNVRPSSGSKENLDSLTLAQLEQKFREKVVLKYSDLKRAFMAFDKKRDGYVTLDELRRVLVHFVFPMSDLMFAQLMERCGIRASHKLPYIHFLDKFKHADEGGNGQTIPIRSSHKVNPIREAELPMEMKELWTLLQDHVTNNYSSIKRAFLAFDDDKDNRVRRKEFRKILDTFPFKLTDGQFKLLMYRIDPEGKGYVSYHDFLDNFESREGRDAHPWLRNPRRKDSTIPPAAITREMAVDILRSKIMDNWKTFSKAFRKIDENSDGFISKNELRNLLYHYHLPITEGHFKELWKICDENRDNRIHYAEFLRNLGVDITPGDLKGLSTRITDESEEKIELMKTDQQSRLQQASKHALNRTTVMSANECIKVLQDHITQRSADLRKTFLKYDYDGDGKVSKKEFRLTLQNLGLLMEDDQFKTLTKRLIFFKGKLSYSDFINNIEEIDKFGEGGKTLHMNNHRFNQVIERSDTMTAEDVEELMRKKINESFQTLRQAFYRVDSNHDAQVTRPEFRRLLDTFMIPISDYEFDRLMTEKLNVPKNGMLSYKDFIEKFQYNENFEKGHPWLFSNFSPNIANPLKNLTAEEAQICLKEKAQDQYHSLATAFRAFDKDGNQIVTKEELKQIVQRFNIAVDKREFNRLWRMYDVDRNGHVDHGEFLERLGVDVTPGDINGVSNKITVGNEKELHRHSQSQQMKQHRAAMNQANTTAFMSAMDVEKQLRDKFRDSFESFRKAFEQVDSSKDGLVSRSELMKILYNHHYYMDDQELANLLKRLGFGDNESLAYEHFLAAFEDPRQSGNPSMTLDSRSSRSSKVSFEHAENLTPEEAIIKLRRQVAYNSEAIRSAFGAFDKSGNGRISIEDLHMIINSFCMKISDKQFKHLRSKMFVQPDGTVDYESFMDSFQKNDAEASRRWLENMLKNDMKSTSPLSPAEYALPSYNAMEEKMSEMIRAKYSKLSKVFLDLDVENNGRIQPEALRNVLNEFTLRLTNDHFNQLWNKFDQNIDGSISYRDVLKYFVGNGMGFEEQTKEPKDVSLRIDDTDIDNQKYPSPSKLTSPINDRIPVANATNAAEIEDSIKPQIVRHWKNLAKSCRSLDATDSGEIRNSNFRGIMEGYGVRLQDDEFALLMRKHDVEDKGRIRYMDFLKSFVLQSRGSNKDSIKTAQSYRTDNDFLDALIFRIKREVQNEWKVMRRAFKAVDRTGSGTCSTIELRQMLRKYKIDLTEEEFYHLMTHFDKEMTGKVSYNDFLKAFLI